jgi:hypothetical protein
MQLFERPRVRLDKYIIAKVISEVQADFVKATAWLQPLWSVRWDLEALTEDVAIRKPRFGSPRERSYQGELSASELDGHDVFMAAFAISSLKKFRAAPAVAQLLRAANEVMRLVRYTKQQRAARRAQYRRRWVAKRDLESIERSQRLPGESVGASVPIPPRTGSDG